MSQIFNRSFYTQIPHNDSLMGMASTTLNATGETCCMVGYIVLENPLSSAKTLSAAGGGSIVWRTGAVTFANAGSTFDVGIQPASTSSSPSQGNGTFDVKASFTGGGGGVTANATNTSVMTTGTATISNGQLTTVTFTMTAWAGADSIIVTSATHNKHNVTASLPCVTENTSGSFAATASGMPLCYIIFDDGTKGMFFGCPYITSVTTFTINSGTATADEYGNLFYLPARFNAVGIELTLNPSSNSADYELILYSDALGTPVAERTVTIDATILPAVATTKNVMVSLSSPYEMKPYTNYALAVRPTTANSVTGFYFDSNSGGSFTGSASTTVTAVRRLDNTGAFSAFNGGTPNTRMIQLQLIGNYIEQGVNNATYQIGM